MNNWFPFSENSLHFVWERSQTESAFSILPRYDVKIKGLSVDECLSFHLSVYVNAEKKRFLSSSFIAFSFSQKNLVNLTQMENLADGEGWLGVMLTMFEVFFKKSPEDKSIFLFMI